MVNSPLLEQAYLVGSLEHEKNNYPLGFGEPVDVANASIFFLSEASRWITGTTLVMDGGLTIN
jgi:NAD(P)-dependent dehydrogenase (short-subunit alcohol dehydrogenase family)